MAAASTTTITPVGNRKSERDHEHEAPDGPTGFKITPTHLLRNVWVRLLSGSAMLAISDLPPNEAVGVSGSAMRLHCEQMLRASPSKSTEKA